MSRYDGGIYFDSLEDRIKPKEDVISKKQALYDELDKLEAEDDAVFCMSSIKKTKKPKKEKPKKEIEVVDNVMDDDMDDFLATFKEPKIKSSKKKKNHFTINLGPKKKKKKDKEKKGHDYKKEFAPELALLKSMQVDQSKFVQSLQRKYDQLDNLKSSARGTGKFTTDFIEALNSARSLNTQLVKEIINTKKTINDLDFKERKEFGMLGQSAQQNMSAYAGQMLKQLVNGGRTELMSNSSEYESVGYDDISDEDEAEMFAAITDSLGEDARQDDRAQKFLDYEHLKPVIHVVWHDSYDGNDLDKQYDFVAYDKYGNVIEDYPLPSKSQLNINRSVGTAVDMYGEKYVLEID